LTNEGLEKKLTNEDVYALFKSVQESVKKPPVPNRSTKPELKFETTTTEDEEHSLGLINLIQTLPANGFEKLCRRLLIEIGISDITITGGSGD
jgi:hypothetical protein